MAYNFPDELVFIGKVNAASAVSTVSFTSGINSNFIHYLLKVRNFYNGTNDYPQVVLSTNGGSSYITTNYQSVISKIQASYDYDMQTTGFYIYDYASTTSGQVENIDVTLYNLTNSDVKTMYSWGAGFDAGGISSQFTAGVQTGTTAVNAIQINQVDSTTFTGNFYLYGII